ncbi:methionyl-tRNA formyltransferase [candidate division KSB1 bacterium]
MKLVFMGNPRFALPTLNALNSGRHKVELVVTGPDRPAGRGRRLRTSPVKNLALSLGLPLAQPEKLSDPDFIETVRSVGPDLFVVVAFRILPSRLLAVPRLGSVNLHASLLPDLRGAAPINWAIIHGYGQTGLSVFFLKERVDTGDIILQRELEIGPEETAGELSERMSGIGPEVMLQAIDLIESGKAEARPQQGEATTAPKLTRDDGRIDFSLDSRTVFNHIRGVTSHPGAYTYIQNKRLIVHRARLMKGEQVRGRPGEVKGVSDDGLLVGTGDGCLLLVEIQMEGKARMAAVDFWRGLQQTTGLILGRED